MTKVMLIAPVPPPYGGIAHWTVLLKERMAKDEGVSLSALINTAPRGGKVIGRSLWERVVGQGMDMFRVRHEMKRHIRQEKPDVIHMTTSASMSIVRDILLMRAAKKYHVPVVYHLHFGRTPQLAAHGGREWQMLRRAMSLADAVITIDHGSYDALVGCLPTTKIRYIPNFFDTRTVPKDKPPVQKEVVFIGWCIKTKGVEELLSAWSVLQDKYPAWTLRLIGPYDERYVRELQTKFSTERVVFDGEKTHAETMQQLQKAAIFTLPSHTEGFPNVVLEAMACEKPIVSTDVGAIAEMLGNGAGLVVQPQNAEALTEALDRLMQDEAQREAMGKAAGTKLEQQYTVDVVFEQLRRLWMEVCV